MAGAALASNPPGGALPSVEFYASPWVSGTRAAVYWGPVSAELIAALGMDFERAQAELLEDLRAEALERTGGKANAIVGLEVTVDLWDAQGPRFRAVGTMALLEPLF